MQMRTCLEAAGSSARQGGQVHVYSIDPAHFATINGVYARYFRGESRQARSFVFVSGWHGPSMSRSTASRWREPGRPGRLMRGPRPPQNGGWSCRTELAHAAAIARDIMSRKPTSNTPTAGDVRAVYDDIKRTRGCAGRQQFLEVSRARPGRSQRTWERHQAGDGAGRARSAHKGDGLSGGQPSPWLRYCIASHCAGGSGRA